MLVGSWHWVVFAVDAALVLVAVGAAAYLLGPRRDGGSPDDDAWREGASELAREVRRAVSTADREVDHDRLARRLLPLSGRIRGHVRAAPASVEEADHRQLFELGVACQRVALEHRPVGATPDGVFLAERVSTLREEAASLERRVRDGRYSKPREKSENAT